MNTKENWKMAWQTYRINGITTIQEWEDAGFFLIDTTVKIRAVSEAKFRDNMRAQAQRNRISFPL